MTCIADGCTRPQRSRGMCDTHYRRLLRKGDRVRPWVRRKPETVVAPGWTTAFCGDCGQLLAAVGGQGASADDAVRVALDNHYCRSERKPA